MHFESRRGRYGSFPNVAKIFQPWYLTRGTPWQLLCQVGSSGLGMQNSFVLICYKSGLWFVGHCALVVGFWLCEWFH